MKKIFLAVCVLSLIACNNQQKQEEEVSTSIEEKAVDTVVEDNSELDLTFNWIAYKFDNKTAVKGSFTKVDVDYNEEGNTPEEKFSGLTFTIDKKSSSTDDAARDVTITNNFFAFLKGDIHGSLGELKDGEVEATITMNEKTVTKTLTYTIEDNVAYFKGEIDILKDFMAETAFSTLHDACSILHEGKTWTDVAVEVTVKF